MLSSPLLRGGSVSRRGVSRWCCAHSRLPMSKECEGTDSLIKRIATQCPNIGLPPLSSRVQIKKALGLGARGASSRWSQMRERA
eukprot:5779895-Pyramimonas_sp.AAC.1